MTGHVPGGGSAAASVIVRTWNSERTLERSIASVRAQTVEAEVLVVDSGSSDGTLALAERLADRVLCVPGGGFSFGGALNAGAAAASAQAHVALSSHCALPHRTWVEVALANLAEPEVVATCSADVDAVGAPLRQAVRAFHDQLVAHPFWGFTNHASAWSARVWQQHPFDERLPACEDREWSWRATRPDLAVVLDPRLEVPVAHRRAAGVRAYSSRLLRELAAYRSLGVLTPYSLRDAGRDWLRSPSDPAVPRGSRPGGRTRAVEVAARWQASRGWTA